MQFPLVGNVPILINDRSSLFTRDHFVRRQNTTFDLGRSRFTERIDRLLPKLGKNLQAKQNYAILRDLLLERGAKSRVLVIGGSIAGAGMESLLAEPRIELVETDVSFGPRTQLICDAHDLPFRKHAFDVVVVQAVLQYVLEPSQCIHEIERVLKHDGLVYAESAFMQQVVHGCYDFGRFTHLGFRRLFRRFEEIRSGPVCGPGMALAWAGQFFLLSFTKGRHTRRVAHVLGRLGLFWLKYFDAVLIDKPGTYDAASGFYFLGKKSVQVLSDRELIGLYRGAQTTNEVSSAFFAPTSVL